MKQRLIDANELHPTYNQGFYIGAGVYAGGSYTLDYEEIEDAPTINAIPVEWLENFTNNYCDLAAAIDTQFFINEFILKRWRVESEGKDWTQVKNNAEKNYQYLKKLLREGKTLEAAKFVEEKENETERR